MIIRSIELNNFGLYSGQQRFLPATALDGSGPITLVGGLNGRGKTSLLEAVLLTLYGNRSPAVRGRESYTAYLESLIHKGADRTVGSAVELVLELPGEKRPGEKPTPILLRIRRSWRVANKRASERLEVWRNDQVDEHLANNWSTYVEDLIPSGLSWLFFFDGEKIATLAEEEETSDSLRIAIRSLLGLDLVDKLLADLEAVMKRNRSKQRDAKGADVVAKLEAELDRLNKLKAHLEQKIAGKNTELLRAEAELQKIEGQYLRAGGTLAKSRTSLEAEQTKHKDKLSEIKSNVNSLAAGPLPLLLLKPLLEQIETAVHHGEQIHQARVVMPLIQKRDNALITKLAEHFPDFTKLDEIARFLEADRADLKARAAQEPAIEISAVAQGQLAALLESTGDELIERVRELIVSYQQTEESLELVSRHLVFQFDHDAMTAHLQKLSQAAQRHATLKHEHELLKGQLADLEGQIKQQQLRYDHAHNHYMDQLDKIDEAARSITVANRSYATMKDFRQKVTARKIHALEAAVTHSFLELTHKKALVTSIRIHPDTLRISLLDGTGQEVLKSRLSSGEKQMLAVAILWGLARASGRDLPVIIDTPMGRLDSSHRMHFVTRYLPMASHQVIVLSTDTEIVGPYLERLNDAIGAQYLLEYDADLVRTRVTPDQYFAGVEGVTA